MVRPVTVLINLQGLPHQRLGLRQAVGGLEQVSQIVQIYGHIGMVRPVTGLINRQGLPHQRLGLRQAVGGFE